MDGKRSESEMLTFVIGLMAFVAGLAVMYILVGLERAEDHYDDAWHDMRAVALDNEHRADTAEEALRK
jgi:hypothetical protein